MADVNYSQFEAYLEGELNRLSLVTFGLEQVKAFKNLTSQVASAKKELDDVKSAISSSKDELAKAKDAEKKAKDKSLKAEESANEEAQAIIAQAKSEAQAFLGKAVLDADKHRQEAFKAKSDADNYVEAKKAEALDWEAKANAAKAAHDAYKAALAGT